MILEKLDKMKAPLSLCKHVSDNNIKTIKEIWEKCDQPYWLVWLIAASKNVDQNKKIIGAIALKIKIKLKSYRYSQEMEKINRTLNWCSSSDSDSNREINFSDFPDEPLLEAAYFIFSAVLAFTSGYKSESIKDVINAFLSLAEYNNGAVMSVRKIRKEFDCPEIEGLP